MMPDLVRIARLDLALLWRNKTAMFTVVGMPVLFGALLLNGGDDALVQGATMLGVLLIFAVFAHLVTLFTARREEYSLKRLRGTALTDARILGGSVLAAAGMYAAQALALLVLMGTAMGGGFPHDPLLLLAGLAGGVAVFALLAFVVSGLSPTTESTQLTILPVMFGCLLGVMFPLDGAPQAVQEAARWLPLTPVVEITKTAYFGRDFAQYGAHPSLEGLQGWAECVRPFCVLAVWVVLGRALSARLFRWEPRRT